MFSFHFSLRVNFYNQIVSIINTSRLAISILFKLYIPNLATLIGMFPKRTGTCLKLFNTLHTIWDSVSHALI